MARTFVFLFLTAWCLLGAAGCAPVAKEEVPDSAKEEGSVNRGVAAESVPSPEDGLAQIPLEAIWEELPLPPTPSPPPTPIPHVPDPNQPRRYFPSSEPDGNVLPTPGAVWRAGHLNGLPKDVDAPFPPGEYADERDFSSVVHVDDPDELPAFLEVNQALVLHLPPLPPDLYVLHVATTGEDQPNEKGDIEHHTVESYRRRFLRIRFNDQMIWQRSLPPYHAITRVALNPNQLQGDGNLITLENIGRHPLPLDAVWVAPQRANGNPLFVALDGGEWLNRKEAEWLRTGVVRGENPASPPSPNLGESAALDFPVAELPSEALTPLQRAEDLPAAWNRVRLRFQLLEQMGHPEVEALRLWAGPIRGAVDRGMYPILKLPAQASSSGFMEAAAYVYGEVVQVWMLPGASHGREWMKVLQTRIPAAVLFGSGTSAQNAAQQGVQSRTFWMGYDLSIQMGRQLAEFFGRTDAFASPPRPDTALQARFMQHEAYNPNWPGSQAGWAFASVAEWLMRRDAAVIVRGGYPGGPFFPEGSDRAGDLWEWMKPMFRFGSPRHRSGVANIVPESLSSNPVFLHWAVADNGSDSVHVLAHTPFGSQVGLATLELPLPWSGPTRMIHHATNIDWKRLPKLERESTGIDLEAVALENPGESAARGWVRLSFQMRGMHVFEFAPAGQSERRQVQAPESVGFARMIETKDLFEPGKEPPPAWWSRKEMGSHFSTDWRPSGPVSVQVKVDASLDGAPGWDALKGVHALQPKTFKGVAPLSDTSTRFQFLEARPEQPRVMRMFFKERIAPKADAVGLWIRAHRPPGFKREFDPFHANPIARFYLGKIPYRQKIEIEYDRWHFISSPARLWTESETDYPPDLLFWPLETEAFQPILEVNSFAAYRLSLEEGIDTPEKTLGFVRERDDGSMALLVVGLPGTSAFWSQRLESRIDAGRIRHIEDEPRVISAESPDDPPPEEVRHEFTWQENARMLEVHIPQMPPAPTGWYRNRILEDFPLIGQLLHTETLSAVLFNEVRKPAGEKP